MVTLTDPPRVHLAGKPILILSGASDPIIPPENSSALAAMLSERGVSVTHKVLPVGHQLSQADLTLSRAWMAERYAGAETAKAS